jgi:hypothetical protein
MDYVEKTAERAEIFDKIYQDYLDELAARDLESVAELAGGVFEDGAVWLAMLNRRYRIAASGVADEQGEEVDHSTAVVLLRYLIHFPSTRPQEDEWIPYRGFRDAIPFTGGFQTNAEAPLARTFSGRRESLVNACQALGGFDPGLDWGYHVKCQFPALPFVPLLLLFNDREEDFPAEARIFFRKDAEKIFDMECLAILGWLLSAKLIREAEG